MPGKIDGSYLLLNTSNYAQLNGETVPSYQRHQRVQNNVFNGTPITAKVPPRLTRFYLLWCSYIYSTSCYLATVVRNLMLGDLLNFLHLLLIFITSYVTFNVIAGSATQSSFYHKLLHKHSLSALHPLIELSDQGIAIC